VAGRGSGLSLLGYIGAPGGPQCTDDDPIRMQSATQFASYPDTVSNDVCHIVRRSDNAMDFVDAGGQPHRQASLLHHGPISFSSLTGFSSQAYPFVVFSHHSAPFYTTLSAVVFRLSGIMAASLPLTCPTQGPSLLLRLTTYVLHSFLRLNGRTMHCNQRGWYLGPPARTHTT
jgi:hypothetical protein